MAIRVKWIHSKTCKLKQKVAEFLSKLVIILNLCGSYHPLTWSDEVTLPLACKFQSWKITLVIT